MSLGICNNEDIYCENEADCWDCERCAPCCGCGCRTEGCVYGINCYESRMCVDHCACGQETGMVSGEPERPARSWAGAAGPRRGPSGEPERESETRESACSRMLRFKVFKLLSGEGETRNTGCSFTAVGVPGFRAGCLMVPVTAVSCRGWASVRIEPPVAERMRKGESFLLGVDSNVHFVSEEELAERGAEASQDTYVSRELAVKEVSGMSFFDYRRQIKIPSSMSARTVRAAWESEKREGHVDMSKVAEQAGLPVRMVIAALSQGCAGTIGVKKGGCFLAGGSVYDARGLEIAPSPWRRVLGGAMAYHTSGIRCADAHAYWWEKPEGGAVCHVMRGKKGNAECPEPDDLVADRRAVAAGQMWQTIHAQ